MNSKFETNYQRRTRLKHEKIVKDFLDLRADAPNVTRAVEVIASKHGLTRQGIVKILKKNNVYDTL